MKQLILLTAILLTSTVTFAQDTTTTETCANGAGTVRTGAVSGHKYCKSNLRMNWWNAMAWCDGQGRRLVSMNDCAVSGVSTASACLELKVDDSETAPVWTATPYDEILSYAFYSHTGGFFRAYRNNSGTIAYFALCY